MVTATQFTVKVQFGDKPLPSCFIEAVKKAGENIYGKDFVSRLKA